MKKISSLVVLFVLFFAVTNLSAQKTEETTKAKKEKAAKQAPTAPAPKLKKDGTPDMRYKASQEKAAKPAPPVAGRQPAPVTPAVKRTVAPSPVPGPTAAARSDRAVGTDDKGRTIYEGPRGGRYYINKNGNKTYLKKGN